MYGDLLRNLTPYGGWRARISSISSRVLIFQVFLIVLVAFAIFLFLLFFSDVFVVLQIVVVDFVVHVAQIKLKRIWPNLVLDGFPYFVHSSFGVVGEPREEGRL